MASPLRQPPALHDRAMQDLSFIRQAMEGSTAFTDLSGWGLVGIGTSALGAAAIARAQPTAGRWLATWLVEAGIAVLFGGWMTWRKLASRRRAEGAPLLSRPARKFFLGFWPAMLAGAVLSAALLGPADLSREARSLPPALPGLWLLLYGVAVLNAGAFSVRAVPLMGAGLMALGGVTLLLPAAADLLLALGFGVWQVAFGIWIVRRHGG